MNAQAEAAAAMFKQLTPEQQDAILELVESLLQQE